MEFKISLKSLQQTLRHRARLIIYLVILLIISWLVYFTYQNLYSSVIYPKEIDKSEIIAKKRKVNIKLFNEINDTMTKKKEVSEETLRGIDNPFE